MWKPEGSTTWSEVFGTLHKVTEDVLNHVYGYKDHIAEKEVYSRSTAHYLVKSGLFGTYAEAELSISLTATLLMAHFLDEFPPIACDVSGNRIELDWVFFTHRDQLELCYFDWPPNQSAQFLAFFKYQKEGGFSPTDLYRRFAFINFETGLLRTSNGASDFLRYQICLEEESVADVLRIAKAVRGYLVCWPEDFDVRDLRRFLSLLEVNDSFGRALDDLFGAMPDDDTKGENSSSASRRGRPAKTPEVLAALAICYPNGIEGLSNKEVWRAIEGHTGKTFKERTVGRAIAAFRQDRQKSH